MADVSAASVRHEEAQRASGMSGPTHPQAEISAAIAGCRAAGLHVEHTPFGPIWGWVSCPTGSWSLPVPIVSGMPHAHARRLAIFLAEHRGHRPGQRW